ncbi:MAG: helix-turn-helix domain-containing protein [Caulobacter sp.]|nr:helix-turn-helix domain-containing protein [Caulobacter sp.]
MAKPVLGGTGGVSDERRLDEGHRARDTPLQGIARSFEAVSNERFASVWDAIENTPAEAQNMKLRSRLMMAVKDHIERGGLSQAQAAQLFGVTQPRISDLVRGKIDLFSIDTLINMLAAAGLHVEMRIAEAA